MQNGISHNGWCGLHEALTEMLEGKIVPSVFFFSPFTTPF
jgi:hypothetical protein